MVSDFIQKHVAIFRIVILLMMIFGILSTSAIANDIIERNNRYDYAIYDGKLIYQSVEAIKSELNTNKVARKKRFKVVIDAGHGGHDTGAVGSSSKEKDLTLSMALKLEKYINKNLPEVDVLLTRNTDVFIPLFRRIQYANDEKADLFISLHCNYISNSKTRGTETFVMGLHRATENLEVAKRENASILLESNYESNYDGYDPNSTEGHIMMSMYQNNYLEKSIEFAANVEDQFSKLHLSKSRGVKQAGFAVLRRASMPSVLVEAGFLSNETDEAFLLSDKGQQIVVESVFNAIRKFHESNQHVQEDVRKDVVADANSGSGKSDVAKNATSNGSTNQATNTTSAGVYIYKVQIAAFRNDNADMDSPELRKIGTLSVVNQNGISKYLVGDYVSRESAEVAREKLKNLGYKGAFIVVLNR
ncbi:MAG TPA: N-acetylmuramoyl-L-alanine amidase [Saprospiraceae bacterium]|nr:N-acetylmuramoyl-L-alanine amidase [Saprospiraceae bacterium]HRP42717.1 N-acetylmuramoyl-L-alanine amidase [Saprospiraceae bacterium]